MKKIDLWINGRVVDLSDDSLILYNYEADSLDNPSTIRNSYSQTVSIKGTPTNNDIFSHIFRVDYCTLEEFNFDAKAKAEMVITNASGEILEYGYAKLESIKRYGVDITYNVALYGQMGSIIYHWIYTYEGEKRTLAWSLRSSEGNIFDLGNLTTFKNRWDTLTGASHSDVKMADLLNFAPAYNGIPTGDFDADKAIVGTTQYNNIPYIQEIGGEEYYGTDEQGILVNLGEKHTEWEMRNIVTYLQQPVMSFKAMVERMIANYAPNLVLDEDWFNDDNDYWTRVWFTLPRLKAEPKDISIFDVEAYLEGTPSPAELLIDYAKTFNLVFVPDKANDSLILMSRTKYYAEYADNVIDLTQRIDRSKGFSMKPFAFSSHWYEWVHSPQGAFATYYEKKYGVTYGGERVNTGFQFDSEITDALKGVRFKGAAQVCESSPLFRGLWQSSAGTQLFAPAFSELVTYKMRSSDGKATDASPDAYTSSPYEVYYDADHPYSDSIDKVQLHDDENKQLDMPYVLLFYAGMESLPTSTGQGGFGWHLTCGFDGHSEETSMWGEYNNGKRCWDLRQSARTDVSQPITQIPHFSRIYNGKSLDMGIPTEMGLTEAQPAQSIYAVRWARYIADRYDTDSRVLKCYVNLNGMRVDADLLRRFYFIDGALWVLTKIVNYCPQSDAPTECEFLRVQEKAAYTVDGAEGFLYASSSSVRFLAGQVSKVLQVYTSDESWEVSEAPDWVAYDAWDNMLYLYVDMSEEGHTAETLTLESSSGLTYDISISQEATAEEVIIIDPNQYTFDPEGETAEFDVVANTDWEVNEQSIPSGWEVEPMQGEAGLNIITITATRNTSGNRSGTINIIGDNAVGNLTYNQAKAIDYETTISPQTISAPVAGQSGQFSIVSNDRWAFSNVPAWMHLTASGSDTANITYTIDANSGASRTASVTFKPEHSSAITISVSQEAAPSQLTATIDGDNYTEEGGTLHISINAVGQGWRAEKGADADWLTLSAESGVAGQATVDVVADANEGSDRTATIHITGLSSGYYTFILHQDAATVYTMEVTPSVVPVIGHFGGTAQRRELSIVTNDSWTLTKPSWLTATPSSGTGDALVILEATENNTGELRSGTIAVTGTHSTSGSASVSQLAYDPMFSIFESDLGTYYREGGSAMLHITSNVAWELTAPDWIRLSKYSGSGSDTVIVDILDGGGIARTGNIAGTSEGGTDNVAVAIRADYSFTLNKNQLTFYGTGGTQTVQIVTDLTQGEWHTYNYSQNYLEVTQSGTLPNKVISVTSKGDIAEEELVIAQFRVYMGGTDHFEIVNVRIYGI